MKQKLEQISKEDCESGFSECAVYPNCNDQSYVAIYVNTNDNIFFESLDLFADKVKGYLVVINFPTFQEVYNVCVMKSERGKSISRKIIETVVKFSLVKLLWLGVFADNPYFDAAVNTYVKVGFSNPKIVEVTPGGFSPGKPFIELIYNKDIVMAKLSSENISNTLSLVKILKEYIDNICVQSFTVNMDNLLRFRELLKLDVETAGVLQLNISETLDIFGHIIHGGSEGVNAPEGNITFHTHPALCYTNNFCYIGWPSGQDMRFVFERFVTNDQVLHFVITVEGIYSIQLTIEFMNYIRKNFKTECLAPVSKIIYAKFTPLEQLRNVKMTFPELYDAVVKSSNRELLLIPTSKHEYMKTAFVSTINSYTFSDLIEDMYSIEEELFCSTDEGDGNIVNFSLFRLGFRSWTELYSGRISGTILSFGCL